MNIFSLFFFFLLNKQVFNFLDLFSIIHGYLILDTLVVKAKEKETENVIFKADGNCV